MDGHRQYHFVCIFPQCQAMPTKQGNAIQRICVISLYIKCLPPDDEHLVGL